MQKKEKGNKKGNGGGFRRLLTFYKINSNALNCIASQAMKWKKSNASRIKSRWENQGVVGVVDVVKVFTPLRGCTVTLPLQRAFPL